MILKRIYYRLRRLRRPPFTIIESILEGNNSFSANTIIARCQIGKFSYFGCGCNFSDSIIGRFCCIGNNVKVIAAQHPTDFISVHPFFYQSDFKNVAHNTFSDYKTLKNRELPPLHTI